VSWVAISLLSFLLSGLLPVASGYAAMRLKQRRFGPSWTASKIIRSGECMCRLFAGPWRERTIFLPNVPAVGALLTVDERTIVAGQASDGHYRVVDVDIEGRNAIASWCGA